MMDIAVLYGASNGELVGKMIANIFAQQPAYRTDLSDAFGNIVASLEKAASKRKR